MRPLCLVDAALAVDVSNARRDELDLQRWPGVFTYGWCKSFAWQCQADPYCREPARPHSFGDQDRGEVFCFMHNCKQPRGRNLVA